MGILQFISKVCVQTAVYWGNPVNDGFGQKTFDEPREIMVRWTDKQQLVKGSDGKDYASSAEVLVQEDLALGGLIYLGTLEDIPGYDDSSGDSSGCIFNPFDLIGVQEIKVVSKIPLIKSTTQFVRTVYL